MEHYKKILNAEAMDIDKKLTTHSQTLINDMVLLFEESRVSFGQRRKKLMGAIEKCQADENCYKQLKQTLDKECEVFFDTIDELLNSFNMARKRRSDIAQEEIAKILS
jgi:hypothetical protein